MGVIELLLGLVPGIVKSMFPSAEDEAKAQALQLELVKAVMSVQTAQLEVNKVEATSTSLFVAGWRPFIGWCSAIMICIYPILQMLLNYILLRLHQPLLPELDSTVYSNLLYGMLGIAGMRTVEKVSGINAENSGSIIDKVIRKKNK